MIEIAAYLATLIVGYVIGFYIKTWLVSRRKYGGKIYVIKKEDKTVYSLELDDLPEMIEFKDEVRFKVEVLPEDADRE